VADPDEREKLQQAFDADCTADFNRKIGLDSEGRPPTGAIFISRTLPAGTVVRTYHPQEATVDVWCSGPFGLTGKGVHEIPIKSSWFTMTVTVRWTPDGWRLSEFSQKDGLEPTSAAAAFGQAPQPQCAAHPGAGRQPRDGEHPRSWKARTGCRTMQGLTAT
jgi:hypothetical protein